MNASPDNVKMPVDFQRISVDVVGLDKTGIMQKWAEAKTGFLVDVSTHAYEFELFKESLAIDLFILSREYSVDTCRRAFRSSCALAKFNVATVLFDQLESRAAVSESDLLEYLNIMPNEDLVYKGVGLLQRVQENSQLRQVLWLRLLLVKGEPEAVFLIPGLLQKSLKRKSLRFSALLSAIGQSGVLREYPEIVDAVLVSCHEDNLLPFLSKVAEEGLIGAVDKSIALRVPGGSEFWSDFIGNSPSVQKIHSMVRLNSIYNEEGVGGVSFGNTINVLEGIRSIPRMAVKNSGSTSIIICAYNPDEYIEHSIRSVAGQGYQDLEIIVIDDCSEVPVEIDPAWCGERKLTVRRNKENLGPYLSRNVGVALAKGEYIGFHDADDWMHPDKISHQIAQMQVANAKAHYGCHIRIGLDSGFRAENNGQFVGDGPITGLFSREVFDRCGLFANTRTRGDVEYRRRIGAVLGASAIATSRIPYVLALDWYSNSKKMIDTLEKERSMNLFLSRSRKHMMLASFVRDSRDIHRVLNMGQE